MGTITVWLSMIQILWKVFLTGLTFAGAAGGSFTALLSCALSVMHDRNRALIKPSLMVKRQTGRYILSFMFFAF
jgi:hypothetical protein